jgi:hypothetical protein
VGPPDQTAGTGPSNPLAPDRAPAHPDRARTGVTLDKRAKQKKSLAGKIADGSTRSRAARHRAGVHADRRRHKPTIEAQDTSASKSAKGTKTTADAGDPTKGTTP